MQYYTVYERSVPMFAKSVIGLNPPFGNNTACEIESIALNTQFSYD